MVRKEHTEISWNCDICKEEIEIEFGFLEYKTDYDEFHICKECLNKMIKQADDEDLLDDDLFR